MTADYEAIRQKNIEEYGKGSRHLSYFADIYSTRTHFIFELLQNAEDALSRRQDSSQNGYVYFNLFADRLEIRHNGAPFVENEVRQDVTGVCGIGEGTKAGDYTQIGKHGIGFKSVYAFTFFPRIHSGEEHFEIRRFVEPYGLRPDKAPNLKADETCIVLPFDNPESRPDWAFREPLPADEAVQEIGNALRNLGARTLLFMKHTEEIRWTLPDGSTGHFCRDRSDESEGQCTVQVADGEAIEEWRVFRRPAQIKDGKDVHDIIVEVAFLIKDGKVTSAESTGLVVYFPTKLETRLGFLIQAPFKTTKTREGIKEDDPANQTIMQIAAQLAADSLETLRDLGLLHVDSYNALPIRKIDFPETGLFSPIFKAIRNVFMEQKLLPASDGTFVSVTTAKLARGEDLVGLLSPQQLGHLLGADKPLYWLTTDITENRTPDLYHYLVGGKARWTSDSAAIEPLAQNLEIRPEIIVQHLTEEFLSRQTDEWIVELYAFLRKQEALKREYLKKPLVRLGDGRHVLPFAEDGKTPNAYFPLDKDARAALSRVPDWLAERVPPAELHAEFNNILSRQKDGEELKEWLKNTLHIRAFSIWNYCDAILSKLGSEYGNLNNEQLIAAAEFLGQYAGNGCKWDDLPVVLADGRKVLLGQALLPIQPYGREIQAVVVPASYDPETGWQHIWQTEDDRRHFVALADGYSKAFCELLLRKGALPQNLCKIAKYYPCFARYRYSHKGLPSDRPNHLEGAEQQLFNSCYNKASSTRDQWNYCPKLYSFERPSSIANDSTAISVTTSKALLAFLNSLELLGQDASDAKLHEYGLKAKCTYYNQKEYSEYSDSAVFLALKECAWLPTTNGLVRPRDAFMDKQGIKEILGDKVPYFSGNLPYVMIERLGIHTDVTIDDLVGFLKDKSGNAGVAAEMVETFKRIYSELESRTHNPYADRASVKRAFAELRLIYIAAESGVGSWHTLDECVWADCSETLGDEFVYLEKHYPKLREFFVERLEVKENVDTECFARQWLKLQEAPLANEGVQRMLVELLYPKIKPVAEQPPAERPDWWSDIFLPEAMLYTQSDTFARPGELVIPDDGEFREIFQGRCEFAWRPEEDALRDWDSFFKTFNVPLLSESVTSHLKHVADKAVLTEKRFVTASAVKMIAAWLKEKQPADYDRLLKDGVFERLLSLKEAITSGEIAVEFRLAAGSITESKTVTYPVFWDRANNHLIYHDPPDKTQLSKTLARGLVRNNQKDLAHWVELVLGATDVARLRHEGWNVPKEILDLCPDNAATQFESAEIGESPETEDIQDTQHEDDATDAVQWDAGAGEDSAAPTIDYGDELNKAFNKKGAMQFDEDYSARVEYAPSGKVNHPDRRGGKLEAEYVENIRNEPTPKERHRETVRQLLEEPDEAVRTALYDWYEGRCQICDKTWPKHDGTPYFVAAYLVERQHGRWIDEPGNAICLCAEHFVQWRHAAKKPSDAQATEQIRSQRLTAEGGDGDLSIRFRMFDTEYAIKYDEPHFFALRKFLEVCDDRPQ